jgi:hypothetical protein
MDADLLCAGQCWIFELRFDVRHRGRHRVISLAGCAPDAPAMRARLASPSNVRLLAVGANPLSVVARHLPSAFRTSAIPAWRREELALRRAHGQNGAETNRAAALCAPCVPQKSHHQRAESLIV